MPGWLSTIAFTEPLRPASTGRTTTFAAAARCGASNLPAASRDTGSRMRSRNASNHALAHVAPNSEGGEARQLYVCSRQKRLQRITFPAGQLTTTFPKNGNHAARGRPPPILKAREARRLYVCSRQKRLQSNHLSRTLRHDYVPEEPGTTLRATSAANIEGARSASLVRLQRHSLAARPLRRGRSPDAPDDPAPALMNVPHHCSPPV